MKERFKPVDPYTKLTPEEKLKMARDRLIEARKLFVLSSLAILLTSSQSREKRIEKGFWINIWSYAFREEEEVSEKLIGPAKLINKGYLTVPAVEDGVRKSAQDSIRNIGELLDFRFDPNIGIEIVNPHIKFTKEIQEKMGVRENPLYEKKPTARKCIFYGTTPKPQREKVAC